MHNISGQGWHYEVSHSPTNWCVFHERHVFKLQDDEARVIEFKRPHDTITNEIYFNPAFDTSVISLDDARDARKEQIARKVYINYRLSMGDLMLELIELRKAENELKKNRLLFDRRFNEIIKIACPLRHAYDFKIDNT